MSAKNSGASPNEKDGTVHTTSREKFDEAARELSGKEWVVADGDGYVLLKHGLEMAFELTDDGLLRATSRTGVVVPPHRGAEVKALEAYFEGWCHKFGSYERSVSGEVVLSCVIPLYAPEDMEKAANILHSLTLTLPAIKECVAGKSPTKSLSASEDARRGISSAALSRLLDSIG